ncbi:hypothetical protein H9L10_15580 [Phycicoccus endophyticus]|uniref:Uncharacterized protein n=1 Tax=Phycicoccus endophyticus TaxID=1690220 RepID=A0A7G9R1T9_9MICO|nr:hypothetical protein [Phycicoccus endophyticus]NHI18638.1 hypothetical protein [Phycicoccus endophyticus]QNN49564.1 hypothetical protein H9L10_15580 [Phycicoccus endophyticus]
MASDRWQSFAATGRSTIRELFDFRGDAALPFTPQDEDVRIVRGKHEYFVRAVHRGEMMASSFAPLDVPTLIAYLLLSGLVDDIRAKRPWKVGVVRVATGGARRVKVVHKVTLQPGEAKEPVVEELVGRVNAGEFDTA